MIINMLMFEIFCDDFMILSYDNVMITNDFRLWFFLAKRKYKQTQIAYLPDLINNEKKK